MGTWRDEIEQAVEAGEREFGPLDAHQTVRHNLIHRCEEILDVQALHALSEIHAGASAMTDAE